MKEETILIELKAIEEKKKLLRKTTKKTLKKHERAMSKLSEKQLRLMHELSKVIKFSEETTPVQETDGTMTEINIETMRELKRRALKGKISPFTIHEITENRKKWMERQRIETRLEVQRELRRKDNAIKTKNGICTTYGCTNKAMKNKKLCKKHTELHKQYYKNHKEKKKQSGN